MKNIPVLLKNVCLSGQDRPCELLIENGVVARLGRALSAGAASVIDCGGNLLRPSLIDCHTHLDKAFIGASGPIDGLMDAVMMTLDYQKAQKPSEVRADIRRRGGRMLELELSHGSGLVRSHVSVDPIWGMEAFYASCELRDAYAGRLDVQLSVPYLADYAGAWAEAARAGRIDYIAGYPTVTPDYRAAVDRLFALAEQFALPLDLHVDESDAPNAACFRYVLEKTIGTGMQGRVNCSHVTALAALPDAEAEALAELCAEAQVSVVALPSCNMYLMGRGDRGLVRRGITRVDLLERAGVNVAIASDNIQDPFRPFGSGNMLEEAYFTCQVLSRGSAEGMAGVLRMASENAGRASGRSDHFLREGAPANLLLLGAKSEKQALIEQSDCLLLLKNGEIVRKKSDVDK